ncbi:protein of unknown function [Verrucomicrobium sp. GAS474]|uniref:DUF4410 domain-containing protein n=1 Tax=Verrucomicrobium sp. GAS474 TaxID=1882831 RepID=UPI00087CC04B|nr:DUF4410 domain-containing protein [Verrucomicrobium sp. GAS474]SDU03730.1 protein of unknown function [Verrucomicrobium sp. GAS474]
MKRLSLFRTVVPAAFALALATLFSSCASVSVDTHTSHETDRMPKKVYVALFETDGADFRVDRDKIELAEFKRELQVMLQKGITTDLSRRLIPAVAAGKDQSFATSENAWLIRGKFTRIHQGSRALRGTIGFGLGRTRYETRVSVYDLSKGTATPFLTFSTIGGSGAEPGAVTAIATDPLTIVIEAAAGGAGGIAHGLTEDTARTAREITAELSDYMYQNRWISEDKWIEPKALRK